MRFYCILSAVFKMERKMRKFYKAFTRYHISKQTKEEL